MFTNLNPPQLNGSGLLSQNTGRVTLFIFRPRRFDRQKVHPYLYAFPDRFTDQVAQVMALADPANHLFGAGTTRDPARHAVAARDSLLASPDAMLAVRPAPESIIPVATDQLSGNWTFILRIMNEPTRMGAPLPGPLSGLQSIYFGYFIDEPINPLAHGAQASINPNAMLVLTNRTLFQRTSAAFGDQMSTRVSMQGYEAVLNPQMALPFLPGGDLYLATPHHLLRTAVPAGGNSFYVTTSDSSTLGQTQAVQTVDTSLAVPGEHLRHLLHGVRQTRDHMVSANALGMDGVLGSLDNLTSTAAFAMSNEDPFAILDALPIDQPITMSWLQARFNGDVDVQPIRFDSTLDWTMDQGQMMNEVGMFQSLLLQALPPMLVRFGLLELAFEYDSVIGEPNPKGFAAATPAATMADVHNAVRGVFTELKRGIFKFMMMRGDFNVQADINVGGMSNVLVNCRCDLQLNNVPFCQPTVVNGLLVPSIMDAGLIEHAGPELAGFMSNVLGGGVDTAPPDPRYASSLSGGLRRYDQTHGGAPAGSPPSMIPVPSSAPGLAVPALGPSASMIPVPPVR